MDDADCGWVVCLLAPEQEEFRSVEPEQALGWCLVYLTLDEMRRADLAGA